MQIVAATGSQKLSEETQNGRYWYFDYSTARFTESRTALAAGQQLGNALPLLPDASALRLTFIISELRLTFII
ncbi:MAG: hypothetical protein GXP28_08895 [Planctomycetes bacterium]|nr:hypothetical protein [Planctomycetota bacterium]